MDEYQIRKKAKYDSNMDPGHWLGLIAIIIICLLLATQRCKAQTAKIDTMRCYPECIEKIVTTTTDAGKIKYFAVYNDKKQNVSDLIPIPQSVMTYIKVCRQNGIVPSLAIRLRNGSITSIMRYKPRYVRK